MEKRREAEFLKPDSNNDGRLSLEEGLAIIRKDKATDGDGIAETVILPLIFRTEPGHLY